MAEDEDAYLDDDEDFEWFYVEDTCPLADELAESVIPEPGYPGTGAELDALWDDLDLYHYWDDLEYGLDPYWDTAGNAVAGGKKRRKAVTAGKQVEGKQLSLRDTDGGTTCFVSTNERRRLWSRRAPLRKGLQPFALLPDWRKRCAAADKEASVTAMPAEMRDAAEGKIEDTPEARRFGGVDMHDEQGDEDEGWEDEDEEEDDMADRLDIDPEALKAALKEKLGAAGLGGMSEDAFMGAMMKMLQGGGDAEDATGELANSLLGTMGEQGEDHGISGWLSRQGVALDRVEEEDDDTNSTAAPGESKSVDSAVGGSEQTSPSDSAIELRKAGRTAQTHSPGGRSKASKKRTALKAEPDDGTASKRRRTAAAAPSEADAGGTAEVADGNVSSAENLEATQTASMAARPSPARRKGEEAEGAAASRDSAVPAASQSKGGSGASQSADEGLARSTRKRKADADAEAEAPAPRRAKKQVTSSVAGHASRKTESASSCTRETRASRARRK